MRLQNLKSTSKKRKLYYTNSDMRCLFEFIKPEATFSNQYKTEDFYSCIGNKNFLFTEGVLAS